MAGGPRASATLGVEVAAAVLQGPSDATALRGETVSLSAVFQGQPSPRVRWLKAVSETSFYGSSVEKKLIHKMRKLLKSCIMAPFGGNHIGMCTKWPPH